ncbi:MAG: hypothetical protein LC624_03215 [Halobacteriales archaeon]|nr:hypothetical protein [Halobacteriales archaeon]
MPRTLRVAEAKQADLARWAREDLQQRGARLREVTHSRTTFDGLGSGGSFRRGGYVGVYQPMGDANAEVLVQVWATAARRAYWAIAGLSVLATVVLLGASPPSQMFFYAALLLWPLFGLAALLYLLTFRASAQAEDELAVGLAERFQAAGLHVVGEEEQLERDIRERLEGEAKQREVDALPKPERRGAAREKRPLFGARKER